MENVKTRSQAEIINDVLDEFDFESVHKAMTALDWQWFTVEGVPDIGELRRSARKRCNEAVDGGYCASGGFYAEYKDNRLSLCFYIDKVWSDELYE